MLSPCSGHTLDTICSEKITCYSSQHDLAHGRITTKLENFGKYGFRQNSKLILELRGITIWTKSQSSLDIPAGLRVSL